MLSRNFHAELEGPQAVTTCGASGGRRADGTPCGQSTGVGQRCIWHRVVGEGTEAEQAAHRSQVARLGALAAALPRVLPSDVPMLTLGDAKGCQRALEQTAQQVRTGALSPDRGAVVVNAVKVAIALGHLMLASRVAKLEELAS